MYKVSMFQGNGWHRGKKKEEDENTKIWISPEWKELCKWNRKHFS